MKKMNKEGVLKAIIDRAIKKPAFRRILGRESHFWFFHIYLRDHVTHSTANFQKELLSLTGDEKVSFLVTVAFRGSGKTTICSLSLPIWAIIGRLKKKFVVVINDTQHQSKYSFMNLKRELEDNSLLRRDMGPFKEESDEWGNYTLYLPWYDAKIVFLSIDQRIRGVKHKQYRPDLIVVDDVEDLESTRTQEGRDKTYQKFKGDILPAGDQNTKMIVIGNLLHEDSLLKRLEREIQDGRLTGIFRTHPVVDDNGKSLWLGKYPDKESLEIERKKIGSMEAWKREFLLVIVPPGDQVIKREWIQHYDAMPPREGYQYRWTKMGIDLAISERETADYTAIVGVSLFGHDKQRVVYVHPHPINKRIDFPTTLDEEKYYATMLGDGKPVEALVEDVAYQRSLPQQLAQDGFPAKGVKIGTQDKRTRLIGISAWIKSGRVLFPMEGCEKLIEQLIGFGTERHDDLVDALVIAVTAAIEARTSAWAVGKMDKI